MDPVSASIVLAGVAGRVAYRRHQLIRRCSRKERAWNSLQSLAKAGIDLEQLRTLCRQERAWFQTVTPDDVTRLCNGNQSYLNEASNLIKLSRRSNATFNFIVEELKDFTTASLVTFLTRQENNRQFIVDLLEAGYDLKELQNIASDATLNGWSESQVIDAIATLVKDDNLMQAIESDAIELVIEMVQNPDAAELVNGVVAICGGVVENGEAAWTVVTTAGELFFDVFLAFIAE
jgi:hypothetical protein